MKKRILYILAAGLIAWNSIFSFSSAFEETLEGGSDTATLSDEVSEEGKPQYISNFGGDNIEIKILDSLTSTDAYLVNLTWSSMKFSYLPGSKVWDPDEMHWINTGGDGSWYRSDNAPESEEDVQEFETVEPSIDVKIENRSSKKLSVNFQAGEELQSLDFESRDQVAILNSAGEETGLSLEITSGDPILEVPPQVDNSAEDDSLLGPYSEIEGYVENYTIDLSGTPQTPAGDDTILIPMTVVFSPTGE